MNPSANANWQEDPARFIEEVLRDPETGQPFRLNQAELRFLAHAFRRSADGRLEFPEQIFSAPKKSGKTAFAAMVTLYVVLVHGGRNAEAFCIANDLEQAAGRVFTALVRIVRASPALCDEARIGATKVEFTTGAVIIALASDFAGAAGANPCITCFDELWGYTSERSRRLWDEMVCPPTRRTALRLTVTYAGFEGESQLLEDLYKRAIALPLVDVDLHAGDGLLCYWTHDFVSEWQTEAWREQMRGQLRTNAYLRLIENKWVSSESGFVEIDWWDACTATDLTPVVAAPDLPVWLGLDASVKRDQTAIVAATWDSSAGKARLVSHRIFKPSPTDPLDFELTVESSLLDMCRRFSVREVRYDPYQLAAVAQRMQRAGVPMIEFPQSVPNLTAASTNLYELIKGRGIVAYKDDEVRLAMQRAVALETSRGWRIAKEKASHKIDVVVAMAMAALGAVEHGQVARETWDPNSDACQAFGESVTEDFSSPWAASDRDDPWSASPWSIN